MASILLPGCLMFNVLFNVYHINKFTVTNQWLNVM